MTELNMSVRVQVPTDVMARMVGDEVVILHLTQGTYYGLDTIGARIWQLLAGQQSLQEIHDALVGEYDVSPLDFERDLLSLIADLQQQGLVALLGREAD